MTTINYKAKISDTPVVFLCGGKGILIDQSGTRKLKTLVEVQGEAILIHLFRTYLKAGFLKFILCTGYQSDKIHTLLKKYNAKKLNAPETYQMSLEGRGFMVEVVETGIYSTTGERLQQISSKVSHHSLFCVNYSDTLSEISLKHLFEFHLSHEKLATLVATRMPTRFRILGMRYGDELVRGFAEKAVIQNDLINGGFYIFDQRLFGKDYLGRTSESPLVLETDILEDLVKNSQLAAFRFKGQWQHLDTERDLLQLEKIATNMRFC